MDDTAHSLVLASAYRALQAGRRQIAEPSHKVFLQALSSDLAQYGGLFPSFCIPELCSDSTVYRIPCGRECHPLAEGLLRWHLPLLRTVQGEHIVLVLFVACFPSLIQVLLQVHTALDPSCVMQICI